MAVTKLMHMKECKSGPSGKHLQNAIRYILNEDKTEHFLYVNANCGSDEKEIYEQMKVTKQRFGKEKGRQGYHFVISFVPGETTEETAYRVAGEFVKKYLQDNYDYVYAVHNDKEHIHAHIIFNSVNYEGYKYRYKKGQWKTEVQPVVDQICKEKGLQILQINPNKTTKTYGEWLAEKSGRYSWRQVVRTDLDVAVRKCRTYPEFLDYLRENGYEIREGMSKKHGRYLALRLPGRPRAFRTYTLGKDYEIPQLLKRLEMESYVPHYFRTPRIRTYAAPVGWQPRSASFYQLNHFRRFYQVRHFYNHQGWQYRADLTRLDALSQQCGYLFRNHLASRADVEECLEKLRDQEKELYRYLKELQMDPDEAGDAYKETLRALKELRIEKNMLQKICAFDQMTLSEKDLSRQIEKQKKREMKK